MFLGVINENYNSTKYLEMELENSLLFFKSLDIVQESGIQIVQESFSDIVGKIKELWTRFKNWVSSIWEKIKGLFSKNKNTVAEIKETNDKIQKGEVKKEEPKKEEPKEEEYKIKWYEFNTTEIDKFEKEFMGLVDECSLGEFQKVCKYKANGEILQDSVNSFIDKLNSVKNQLNNIDIKHRFFKENTFSIIGLYKSTSEQHKSLADNITKASEDLGDNEKEFEDTIKKLQKEIDDTDKKGKEILKHDARSDGLIVSGDGFVISVNNFNGLMSNIVSVLHSMVGILSRLQGGCSSCLNANKAALNEMVNFL